MKEMRKVVRKYGGTLTVGGRKFRRFIPFPGQINDGTCRCIACGQIDEPEYHIAEACRDAADAMLAHRQKGQSDAA